MIQTNMISITRRPEKLTAKFRVRENTSDIKAVEEVWKKNSYQRKLFKIVPGETWLDLGSNVGSFSVFAGLRGCQVRSYEADAYNAQATHDNMQYNNLLPDVVRAAIVNDDYMGDTIRFYISNRPMALRRHSIYKPVKDFLTEDVPVIRFSELPLDSYDCIKMNIEGAEIDLLERVKRWGSVKKLVLEYSWDKDPSIARFQNILRILRKHFKHVDHNKRLPDGPEWIHYPPNIFVYCTT